MAVFEAVYINLHKNIPVNDGSSDDPKTKYSGILSCSEVICTRINIADESIQNPLETFSLRKSLY